jgi:hypothetical protein
MKKQTATVIGSSVGLISVLLGFYLRFNAHELAETRDYNANGRGYSSTFNLYHQSVYQELGLALLIFGLALLLVVFYFWLRAEIIPHNQLQQR